jgi:hypothetical protein
MCVYNRETFEIYKERKILAADSGMRYLTQSPRERDESMFLTRFEGERVLSESEHNKLIFIPRQDLGRSERG